MKKVLIYGSGGHGKVVLDILLSAGEKDIAGFVDDSPGKAGQEINGYPVLGTLSQITDNKDNYQVALGIGDNKIREKTYLKARDLGFEVVQAVHPTAVVSQNVEMGEGVVVMPGAVVNANTVLGNGVVVNTGATVDHDCNLEQFSQVWPGANLAGTVHLGEYSYVGTGAAIIQSINIGKNVIVGAGAVVISDIPDNVTAVGMPAKVKER
ncbi:acetyltransferase [Candidatus Margulisiibacteriota bacterium]